MLPGKDELRPAAEERDSPRRDALPLGLSTDHFSHASLAPHRLSLFSLTCPQALSPHPGFALYHHRPRDIPYTSLRTKALPLRPWKAPGPPCNPKSKPWPPNLSWLPDISLTQVLPATLLRCSWTTLPPPPPLEAGADPSGIAPEGAQVDPAPKPSGPGAVLSTQIPSPTARPPLPLPGSGSNCALRGMSPPGTDPTLRAPPTTAPCRPKHHPGPTPACH